MNHTTEKLAALRGLFRENGIDGFIVPNTDEFQGEYIPACAKRLEWLTGFSGSAGTAVILKDKAAFFTDGRYTLQAKDQVDNQLFEQHNSQIMSPQMWLAQHTGKNVVIGYDAWLHTLSNLQSLSEAAICKPVKANLIDALWKDRSPPPLSLMAVHEMAYAGESTEDKIKRILKLMGTADSLLLTAPDSICWLLNIRGADVPYTPFSLCFALLHKTGKVTLFCHLQKVTDTVKKSLGDRVEFTSIDLLENYLKSLKNKNIQLDKSMAAAWFTEQLTSNNAAIHYASDPCQLAKACKNNVEIEGARTAHLRDGAAVSNFLCWLDSHVKKQDVTEISVAETLLEFRKEQQDFIYPSFATIAGFASNGAIVHYHAEEHTSKQLKEGMFLLDSGGQYLDGTTDITRTIIIGSSAAEQKDRFTRVLKGHIQLAMVRFPKGTTGSQLDVLARHHLWREGLDYDHGTGHGVGSYLSVHEGPQRISKANNNVALQPGMILSNEPGYYKAGEYGIRIENLVTVVESKFTGFYEFETLTCVPIDRNLIEASLLSDAEKKWLNNYHQWVYNSLHANVKPETLIWLENATQAI